MGFLGEIERRKQEQIRQELSQKAERELQQQIDAQNEVDRNRRIEEDARGFIKSSSTITTLLNQLYQFGYKGYFEKVSEITEFKMEKSLYTEFPRHRSNSADGKLLFSQWPEKGSELAKQQFRVQEELVEAASRLGWRQLMSDMGIDSEAVKPPSEVFLNHNIPSMREKGLSEPQNVGIGIHFLKKYVEERRVHRNAFAELLRIEHDESWEYLHHAVYIRIDEHNGATITGSIQRQVELKDLRLFDEVLQQAFNNPATIHESFMQRWYPPYSGPRGGSGYASSGETAGPGI